MFISIDENTPLLDDKEKSKALKRFEWLISFLICRFKFVHHMLGMTRKIETPGLGTMGVRVTNDGKFELGYDPVWFNRLTDAEATYIFYHEIGHMALHHCTRRPLIKIQNRKRPTPEEQAWHEIANIAHDLAVNELIPVIKDVCEPPRDKDGNLVGTHVKELKKNPLYKDIEERQTAEWYFEYLKSKMPPAPPSSGGKGGKELEGLGGNIDDHSDWQEHEMADTRVATKVKHINDMNHWGDMSQTCKELILAAQVRKINWRTRIKVWFGNQAWRHKMNTRKRPNRRYGWMHPGSKTLYVDRWLVATDTSGSIDPELLAQWIGVLNQIAEELPIDLMQFDCEKTEDPKPYERRHTKFEFKGRGGTDFQPVIDIVNKRRYKGVMILTDGEAGTPSKPKMAQVLWVLPAGCNPPVDWGTKIHLTKYS